MLSWDEFAKQKRREFGMPEPIPEGRNTTARYPVPSGLLRPQRLYNVHKRSLPVGVDKVVVLAVSENEACNWIEKRLKSKPCGDRLENFETVIYYDVVPVDATPNERSVYFNTGRIVT